MGKSKCAKSPISYLTTAPPEFETSKLLLKAVALAYSYGNQTVEIGTEINNLITSVCEIKTSVSFKCSENHFCRGKAKIKVEKC